MFFGKFVAARANGQEPSQSKSSASPNVDQDAVASEYLERVGFGQTPENYPPKLAVLVPGHQEDEGHTWYIIKGELTVDNGTKQWHTRSRLLQLREGLYDRIRQELDAATYAKYFQNTPFALRGGLPGTTVRLAAWCGALAEAISSGSVEPHVTALVLRFLSIPEGHAGHEDSLNAPSREQRQSQNLASSTKIQGDGDSGAGVDSPPPSTQEATPIQSNVKPWPLDQNEETQVRHWSEISIKDVELFTAGMEEAGGLPELSKTTMTMQGETEDFELPSQCRVEASLAITTFSS